MAIKQSDAAFGKAAAPAPHFAGEAVTKRYAIQVSAAPSVGDIFELAPIPANCRVADMVLDTSDLDTNGAPAMVLDVGIMSGAWSDTDQARTCGAEFFSASNLAQSGGVARPSIASAYRTGFTDTDRSIGVKVTTAAATFAAGFIGLTVTVVAAD